MRLLDIRGKPVKKDCSKCLIKWGGKSRSKIQFAVKQFLKQYWQAHVVYEEFPVFGSKMRVDILNATKKIAIEVNGNQHEEFNPFFHNDNRQDFHASIMRDYNKLEWLEKNGFTLIEIKEEEVKSVSLDFFKDKFGVSLV